MFISGFIFGAWAVFIMWAWYMQHNTPKVTLKVIPRMGAQHEEEVGRCRAYSNELAPLVNKFVVAAMMDGGTTVFNQLGSESMARLLRDLGRLLDRAVDLQHAERPSKGLDNLVATCYIPHDNTKPKGPK